MKPSIEIINLGKKYSVQNSGRYSTLRDYLYSLKYFYKKKEKKEDFWALKNIFLNINAGEVIGIIGRNGAGKSTLLKILTNITPPTSGKVILKGRVCSLLEVGTGFHPELSGRENIYLNGVILGMKKEEINKKFNEIVSFAGVEDFIDEPVKHYSSGMYTRLAFAVAAHLDSDILIIDEVLAVGDWEFQKKCLGKIEEMSNKKDKIIIFVSHDMQVIKSLCNKIVYLVNGEVSLFSSDIDSVITNYLKSGSFNKDGFRKNSIPDSPIVLKDFYIEKNSERFDNSILFKFDEASINVKFEINKKISSLVIGYDLYYRGNFLFRTYHTDDSEDLEKGSFVPGIYSLRSDLPLSFLNSGDYYINFISGLHPVKWYHNPADLDFLINFSISDFAISKSMFWNVKRNTMIAPVLEWKIKKNDKSN